MEDGNATAEGGGVLEAKEGRSGVCGGGGGKPDPDGERRGTVAAQLDGRVAAAGKAEGFCEGRLTATAVTSSGWGL